jgi:predicted DNA-binding transcriptional regulator AlpA
MADTNLYEGCLDTSLLKREIRVDKTFLMKFFGLSEAGFEYRIRHTDFPLPVRIGKKRYWRSEQILQYLNAQEKQQTRGWSDTHYHR